jgi:hypothetical protein
MCIKHHNHCSVESVAERGAAAPLLSSMRGTGRRVVETLTTHVPRVSRIRDTVRDCLAHSAAKIPTVQYIINNIKRAVWRLVSSFENDPAVRTLEFLFPSPSPPEKIHNPPKTHPPANVVVYVWYPVGLHDPLFTYKGTKFLKADCRFSGSVDGTKVVKKKGKDKKIKEDKHHRILLDTAATFLPIGRSKKKT